MKQITRNFLVGFAVGSLGIFAWGATAATAYVGPPAVDSAPR